MYCYHESIIPSAARTMPKVGEYVECPADAGEFGYIGRVTHVSDAVNMNHAGQKYRWISVFHNGHNTVWPSNRLGIIIR